MVPEIPFVKMIQNVCRSSGNFSSIPDWPCTMATGLITAEPAELGEEMDTQEIANRKMIEAGFTDPNDLRKEVMIEDYLYFPMLWFAEKGDLKMLRYLFAHGAEEDVLREESHGKCERIGCS